MTKNAKLDNWVVIVPVGNLVLTESVHREFKIIDVTFVNKMKLPYIRKRLGFKKPVSETKKWNQQLSDLLEVSDTFAVLRRRGVPKEIYQECIQIIRNEIYILSLSQLGYSNKKFSNYVELFGEHSHQYYEYGLISMSKDQFLWGGTVSKPSHPLALTGHWKNFQKQGFYFKLLKILNKETNVTAGWRKDLEKTAILIGKSFTTKNISDAFLWKMIALEILLTRRGDNYSTEIPKRAEAFLGWVGFWNYRGYKNKILEVYDKRNKYVHSGMSENINEEDLGFLDLLLYNLLANIVSFPELFGSKEEIVKFSERVAAEKVLGIRSSVRPKKFSYLDIRWK